MSNDETPLGEHFDKTLKDFIGWYGDSPDWRWAARWFYQQGIIAAQCGNDLPGFKNEPEPHQWMTPTDSSSM